MDTIPSRYICGYISDNLSKNAPNLRKMESLLENVVKNFEYCRKIIIPIHNVEHWHLMEVNFEDKEIRDYNSLREYMNDQKVARWSDWFGVFFVEMILDMHLWLVSDVVSFPQQESISVECGVFLMKAIEQIAYDNMIMFTHEDMSKYKGEIAASILRQAKIVEYVDFKNTLPKCGEGHCII